MGLQNLLQSVFFRFIANLASEQIFTKS